MSKVVKIEWTAAHLDEAREIVQALIAKGLISCGSIFPLVESWYIWEGDLQQSSEVKVMLKTLEKNYPKVEAFIRQNHSYDLPEILMYPVAGGYQPYLHWIEKTSQ